MLDNADKRWNELKGGYRTLYNPLATLQKLVHATDPQPCWDELWQELYHQGDVGDASYAAVVVLADMQEDTGRLGWNCYNLAGTIELARLDHNAEVPSWLREAYAAAWKKLYTLAIRDLAHATEPLLISSILGVVALIKKQLPLAAMLLELDEEELKDGFKNR